MNEIMQYLYELQTLEFEETIQPTSEARIEALRAKIPKPVLAHYDRLCDSGKKGVSILRNDTCTACHMKVPRGVVINLMHGDDVCLCGNCGRYLHLLEPAPAAMAAPAPKAPKAKAAARKSNRLATV